uniref:NADH-ubiquinone oxidoreductase chain 2 n=1 Tax=Parasagitta elegans TaxID=1562708 RepID=A0A141CLA5_9BILA|nr:NADH dehydrogenase subunit 2 [Parasagitta elegans]
MLYGVMLGTLVVAASFSWPVAWIGLELNLMAFIPVTMYTVNTKKVAMNYFVCQSCGSLMVVVGGMLSDHSVSTFLLLLSGLMLKMGLMPLHFWVPMVVSSLSRFNLYLLISWQKLAPLILVLTSTCNLGLLSALNAFGGSMSMCSVSCMPLLLAFSGMVQMGWVLVTNGAFTAYYLSVYFLVLSAVVYFSAGASFQFGWALLNAGGLPPLSGFIIKLKAILNIKNWLTVGLVGSSGLALCSYVRLLMNARLKPQPVSILLVVACSAGLV